MHHFTLEEIKKLNVHHYSKNRSIPEGDFTPHGVFTSHSLTGLTSPDLFKVPTLLEAATFVKVLCFHVE